MGKTIAHCFTKLVGTNVAEHQAAAGRFKQKDRVWLVVDEAAQTVRAFRQKGEEVGALAPVFARDHIDRVRRGFRCFAFVNQVTGGTERHPLREVLIALVAAVPGTPDDQILAHTKTIEWDGPWVEPAPPPPPAPEPKPDPVPAAAVDPAGQWLAALVDLAGRRRLVEIEYAKPGDGTPTTRLIEPYRLQDSSGNLMVLSWQVSPEVGGRAKWRNFRLDRIVRVGDGGTTFAPRCDVTICEGEVTAFSMDYQPARTTGGPAEYAAYVEEALLDGRLTKAEQSRATELRLDVSDEEMRGVHARIFMNVLQEVLADGTVSEQEEEYLAKTRRFLKRLGWAP